MKIKNLSFNTWQNNHDSDHKDKWYRELYPFNIFQLIDFDKSQIGKTQTINNGLVEYYAELKTIALQDNGRFKAQVNLSSKAASKTQEWKNRKWQDIFEVIYSQNYDFITVFTKKKDPSKEVVKRFMSGNFDRIAEYRSIPISELLIRTLILHIAEDKFPNGKHRELFKIEKEGIRKVTEHPDFRLKRFNFMFDPIFSVGREIWVCHAFTEEKAHRLAFRYSNQCESLFVIYSNPTFNKHHRCSFQNTFVISLFDFASYGLHTEKSKFDNQIRFIQNHLNKPEEYNSEKLLAEIQNPSKSNYEIKKSDLMEAFAYLKIYPLNEYDFFHSLCCFNLVNAFLSDKTNQPMKKRQLNKFKDMYYYKTYLAKTLSKMINKNELNHPLYITKDLIYIEVFYFQFSFHAIPLDNILRTFMKSTANLKQEWRGKRLQPIAPLLLNYSRSLNNKMPAANNGYKT